MTSVQPGEGSKTGIETAFVGRQPIYDPNLRVVGYELLFRDGPTARVASFSNVDDACRSTIVSAILDIGLDRLVGGNSAFVNLSRRGIVDFARGLPAERVVLEVLEDVEADEELVLAVQELKNEGYTIALDDFEYRPELQPLIDQADLIKLDILNMSEEEIRSTVDTVREVYDGKLLAEKIENREIFELCKELGFELFQGYFLSKPVTLSGKRVPTNRMAVVRMLLKLREPDIGPKDLESLVAQDASLSYQLLRYINSAKFGRSRPIESIAQALVMLGMGKVRDWTTLLLMAKMSHQPKDLLFTTMVRAKMCEGLSEPGMMADAKVCFTAGLLSGLDAILGASLESVLSELPVSEEMKGALLYQEGPLGEALGCVLAYEKGEWDQVQLQDASGDLIMNAYLEAISWAEDVTAALGT